jgi:hypothetical protein
LNQKMVVVADVSTKTYSEARAMAVEFAQGYEISEIFVGS